MYETEKLEVVLSKQAIQGLDRLVGSGLYGKNRAEAAERLIARGIEDRMLADPDDEGWRG